MQTSLPYSAPSSFWLPSSNSTNIFTHLRSAITNTTSAYLHVPSTKDLAYLPLRIAGKADRAIVQTLPRFLLRHSGLEAWSLRTSQAANAYMNVGAGAGAGAGIGEAAVLATRGQVAAQTVMSGWKSFFGDALSAGTFKSYWGMLHYLTSRWAFSCFVMALVLNRVQIYGSSRQRIRLRWGNRLLLRLLPCILFVAQIHRLLQAIQCQSSPDFLQLRYGVEQFSSTELAARGMEWASRGGFLHKLSSTLLYKTSDSDCCAAVGMSSNSPTERAPFGSFSLLWPVFLRLSLSHILETVSCSLQQLPVMTEVGMSVFEHSLAFAEVEIMVSQSLGLGAFATSKATGGTASSNATMIPASGTILAIADATASMTGPHKLDRVNVPIEVLLIALLSCCNALSSNIVSILGRQRQWRLLNTGFWGLCFMASFVWGFSNTSILVRTDGEGNLDDARAVSSLLHFPTVAIVGFLPHVSVLLGMCACVLIYWIALLLTAFSLNTNPNIPQPSSIRERFTIAHENLQAAIQVRGINIKWHEDFYTALLRIGFAALTAASEAVFLNEGRSVEMRQFTWLEEERLDEIEASHSTIEMSRESTFQIAEAYGVPPALPGATDQGGKWKSGYAKERKLEKDKETGLDKLGENSIVYPHPGQGGVGAMQRTTRFYLLFIFIRGIFFLMTGYIAYGIGAFLDKIGITARPRWLQGVVGRSRKGARKDGLQLSGKQDRKLLDFWLLSEDGTLTTPKNDEVDVAHEMRRRMWGENLDENMEEVLDERIYGWWKMGGWFGTKDESGEYGGHLVDDVEDTTSVFSISTVATSTEDDERGWESEQEGQRTPTKASPFPGSFRSSRESSAAPFNDTPLDSAALARLLNPPDKASKEEARILASHFAGDTRIMTRSRYRHELESERSRILLAGRSPQATASGSSFTSPRISLYHGGPSNSNNNTNENRPLTPAEEAEILETLILSRRRRQRQPQAHTEDQDHRSFHASGPACVVCQAAPRTIIAWPCRCLCVCEDCRVNLALNNFANCVTCRRSVGGFVRLWVP